MKQFVIFAGVLLLSTGFGNKLFAYSGVGSGTEAEPYQISSRADMEQLATAVNGGQNYSGVHFRLTRDLTGTTDTLTTLVGNSDNAWFSGIFDGGEHKIAVDSTGIFGLIRNATIKNLGVTGSIHTYSYSSGDDYYVGGICGVAENSTIINCYNNAEIATSISGNPLSKMYSGGICGKSTNSTIINCHNTENISAAGMVGYSTAGGITGCYEVGGAIMNCYNTGNIATSAVYKTYVGGITGVGGAITN
jgi:hypothetical protein